MIVGGDVDGVVVVVVGDVGGSGYDDGDGDGDGDGDNEDVDIGCWLANVRCGRRVSLSVSHPFIYLLIGLFTLYRFVEKGNLEVQLFILTSKLRANHQKSYVPPDGITMNDINKVHSKPLSS